MQIDKKIHKSGLWNLLLLLDPFPSPPNSENLNPALTLFPLLPFLDPQHVNGMYLDIEK